jgi:hypothetical protein
VELPTIDNPVDGVTRTTQMFVDRSAQKQIIVNQKHAHGFSSDG